MIKPTIALGYRDYLAVPNSVGGWGVGQTRCVGSISVDHGYPDQVRISIGHGPEDDALAEMTDRDEVRRLGTDLIQFIGSNLTTWGVVQYDTSEVYTDSDDIEHPGATLQLRVSDSSIPDIIVGSLVMELSHDDALDLGQRLIVWAGVNPERCEL